MKDEILRIQFPYVATYRRPKRRTFETDYFRGEATFTVRSASAEEAPTVCHYTEPAGEDGGADTDNRVCQYQGRFFRAETEIENGGFLSLDRLRFHSGADGGAQWWGNNPFVRAAIPRFGEGAIKCLNDVPRLEEHPVQQVSASTREECEARIWSALDDHLMVDGIFYVACEEPVLIVDIAPRQIRFMVSAQDDGVNRGQDKAVFRADRLPDAVSYAQTLIAAMAPEEREEFGEALEISRFNPDHVVVDRPDLLSRNDNVAFVRDCIEEAVRRTRPVVPFLSRDGLTAFADFREAGQIFKKDGGEAAANAFMACYERVAKDTEGLSEQTQYEIGRPLRFFREMALVDLVRWRGFEGGRRDAGLVPAEADALSLLA